MSVLFLNYFDIDNPQSPKILSAKYYKLRNEIIIHWTIEETGNAALSEVYLMSPDSKYVVIQGLKRLKNIFYIY